VASVAGVGRVLVILPPAFLIVDEADVLRDEGEAYAARLRAAGVPITTVRDDGITHDFTMLNALSGTHATGPPSQGRSCARRCTAPEARLTSGRARPGARPGESASVLPEGTLNIDRAGSAAAALAAGVRSAPLGWAPS
jgi:acetyl esterase/lipase